MDKNDIFDVRTKMVVSYIKGRSGLFLLNFTNVRMCDYIRNFTARRITAVYTCSFQFLSVSVSQLE